MKNTKIETFTDSWNPVQGCLRGCRYCYAASFAKRFGGHHGLEYYMCQEKPFETGELHVLDNPMRDVASNEAEAYPFGFDPTFCRYRLNEPAKIHRPGNIFVGSMGDLFGPWVPDEWIEAVFDAARKAPHHNYVFLTKYPERYQTISAKDPNFLFGATVDSQQALERTLGTLSPKLRYLSIEPLQEQIDLSVLVKKTVCGIEWVAVGAEKGNATGRVKIQKEWVSDIAKVCNEYHIPLFMKNGPKTKSGKFLMPEMMGDELSQALHPLLNTKRFIRVGASIKATKTEK